MKSMKLTCVLYCILLSSYCYSQTGPSNISNCKLWLRADLGTLKSGVFIPKAGNLDKWEDQSGSGNHTTSVVSSPYKLTSNSSEEKRQNYNPVVFFDSQTDLFSGPNLGMHNDNTLTEFYVLQNSAYVGNNFKAVFSTGFSGGVSHRVENSNGFRSFVLYDNNYSGNLSLCGKANTKLEQRIMTAKHTGTNFIGYNNGTQVSLKTTSTGINSNGPYKIGNVEGGAIANKFSISEVILFNRTLTLTEQNKVESYLAIKYGITLGHDYYNSSGSKIYDVSTYNNDIIGIIRDDVSNLHQKQSHQLDDHDSTRIYIDNLKGTNYDNSGAFSSNNQSIIMGHNNGSLGQYPYSYEYPSNQGVKRRFDREWKLTNTNFSGATFSIDIKLNVLSPNLSDYRLLVDSDDGNFSNATLFSPTFSFSNGVLTISGLDESIFPANSTSYFTLASLSFSSPLPIELVFFSAKENNGIVDLLWETASEIDNDYFTIERSNDGINYEVIENVNGAGNSSQSITYVTKDRSPLNGVSYYRLKQTDFDGQFLYSKIKSVKNNSLENSMLSLYPNPVKGNVTLNIKDADTYNFILVNSVGQKVECKVNKNTDNVFLLTERLPKGVYFINIINVDYNQVIKLIKE